MITLTPTQRLLYALASYHLPAASLQEMVDVATEELDQVVDDEFAAYVKKLAAQFDSEWEAGAPTVSGTYAVAVCADGKVSYHFGNYDARSMKFSTVVDDETIQFSALEIRASHQLPLWRLTDRPACNEPAAATLPG